MMMRYLIVLMILICLTKTPAYGQLQCRDLLASTLSIVQQKIPIADEVAPSSLEVLEARTMNDVNAYLLESFGTLLTQRDSSLPATLLNHSLQQRNWDIFQSLYGIQVERDELNQWMFVFHQPRSPEEVAARFQLSVSRLETIIQEMHFVRIKRLRIFDRHWDAYRMIVDRVPVFGKNLEDYVRLYKSKEKREEAWQNRRRRF